MTLKNKRSSSVVQTILIRTLLNLNKYSMHGADLKI